MRIVVIGASMGGLTALQTVLSALPPDFPAAVAIVQHRPPDADDTLVELLQRRSRLAVSEAEDKEPIRAGQVYLAPPDYHLLIDCGMRNADCGEGSSAIRIPKSAFHFALSTEPPVNYARPSIDVLFESAAEAYGAEAVGVILTGSNDDGAAGLAAVRARGGLAVAQDLRTAAATPMPEAAILSGAVDVVLPLEEIGDWLNRTVGRDQGVARAAADRRADGQ